MSYLLSRLNKSKVGSTFCANLAKQCKRDMSGQTSKGQQVCKVSLDHHKKALKGPEQ